MTRLSRIHAVAAAIAILVGAASLSAAQGDNGMNQDTPDMKELREYQLTADKLNRFESAAKAYQKMMKDNPGLEDKLRAASGNNSGPNTIAQSTAALDKFPQLTGAIKPFGFSSHEYIVMAYELMNAYSYAEVKKGDPSAPMPLSVSAANAAFASNNYARVQALMQLLSE
jgi:hypothetical protein